MKNKIIALALTLSLTAMTSLPVYAINSKGIIKYENDTNSVVFDANDLKTIEDNIVSGKQSLVNALKRFNIYFREDGSTQTGSDATTPSLEGIKNISFLQLANAVSNSQKIPVGKEAALARNLLTGKSAWVDGTLLTGTMIDNEDWNTKPTTLGRVTIPEGYHNGNGYVDTDIVYNQGITYADSRLNKESVSYKEGSKDAVLTLYDSDSSREEALSGDSFRISVDTTNGSSPRKTGSFSYDSGLIPIIKEIDGKQACLISIVFTVEKNKTMTNYGGETSDSSVSYNLEWEDGTVITSGETCTNLYTNLFNYELGSNTGIRLTANGTGSCQAGTHQYSSADSSASISDIRLVYKIFG